MISLSNQIGTFNPYMRSDYCNPEESNTNLNGSLDNIVFQNQNLEQFDALSKVSDTFYLHAEKEGGFVAFSEKYSGAVGQGESEEEAAHDLRGAIEALEEFYLENPDW